MSKEVSYSRVKCQRYGIGYVPTGLVVTTQSYLYPYYVPNGTKDRERVLGAFKFRPLPYTAFLVCAESPRRETLRGRKADIMLIKRGDKGIEDVIVVENKLSESTDYTIRQKEGWKKIANNEILSLKYDVKGKGIDGSAPDLTTGNKFVIKKERVFKISDHVEADLINTTLQNINVEGYKNYSSKVRK